ncbi:MAG: rhomboid family intramembrane serine protease [Anaerolineales bacterium]
MFIPLGTEEQIPRQRFPIVTATIVGINTLVFLFQVALMWIGGERALYLFITAFGIVPAALVSGQNLVIPFFLTPFTSMFVHGSLTHILFNMVYLVAFADNVEDRLGHWRFLAFYLLAGLVAGLAQVLVDVSSTVPTVGASGAIAGVLAAYVVLFPQGKVRMFLFLGPLSRIRRVSALFYIAIWFAMQFFSGVGSLGVATAETGGVAYWAHIGGFLAGLMLAILFRRFGNQGDKQEL